MLHAQHVCKPKHTPHIHTDHSNSGLAKAQPLQLLVFWLQPARLLTAMLTLSAPAGVHCSRQLTHLLLPVLAVLRLQLSLQRVSLRLQLPLLLRLLPPLLLPLLPLQPLLLLNLSLDGRLRKEETRSDIISSFVVSGYFSHLLPPPVGGSFFISPQPPTPHNVWGSWRDNNITYGAPSCKSPGCLQRQPMTLSHLFRTLPILTSYPVSLQPSMLTDQD